MTYLSIIDKLMILLSLLKESILVLVFIGIIVFAIILKILKKISNKKLLIIITLSLIGAFLAVILSNYSILSKTFDNFLDIFFTNIYFPSIYIYLFMIFSTYIITIVTIIDKKIPKITKISNYSMSLIINIILILNLNIIAKDKIDIFSTSSLYTNINLVSMLELSTNIYILWMVVISAIYIINHITGLVIEKKELKELLASSNKEMGEVKLAEENRLTAIVPEVPSINSPIINIENNQDISSTVEQELELEIANQELEPKYINNNAIDQIKNNISSNENNKPIIDEQPIVTPNKFTFNEYVKKPNSIAETTDVNSILNNIFNNTLPLQKETKKEEHYSLNDYKTFSKMLKELVKMNNRTTLNINDMLSLNLLNKFSYEEYSLFKKMLKSFTNEKCM
jgi:hypothetical protein